MLIHTGAVKGCLPQGNLLGTQQTLGPEINPILIDHGQLGKPL